MPVFGWMLFYFIFHFLSKSFSPPITQQNNKILISTDKCDVGEYRDDTLTVCTKCPVNTISQQTGAVVCVSCVEGEVSNDNRDSCSESYESLLFRHFVC